MLLGKITGTVVASQKDDKLVGQTFHIVENVDVDGHITGGMVVAVDAVGAGVGEIVLYAGGSAARLTPVTQGKPVDHVIMAIVDTVEINGTLRYQK